MVWPPTSSTVRVLGKKWRAPRAAAVSSVTWVSRERDLMAAESGAHHVSDLVLARPAAASASSNAQVAASARRKPVATIVFAAIRPSSPEDDRLGVGRADVDSGGEHHADAVPSFAPRGLPTGGLVRGPAFADVVEGEERGSERAHELRFLADVHVHASISLQRLDHAAFRLTPPVNVTSSSTPTR